MAVAEEWRARLQALAASLLLLLLLPTAASQGGDEGSDCADPDGRRGTCVPIARCPPMLELLAQRPSQDILNRLNSARCGFQGSVPIVCCAEASAESPAPPPSPPPPTPAPTALEERILPEDVATHPRLGLLPLALCSPGGSDRIVGGKVADVFAYPWIARLGYRSRKAAHRPVSYRCGGALVSERYVLTAAHCVDTGADLRLVTVKLGEHTVGRPIDCRTATSGCLPPPIDVDVERTVVHPGYGARPTDNHHDVALVRLARRVDFAREDFVRPVCLPVGATQTLRLEGVPLVAAGWGLTERNEGSAALRDVLLPAVPNRQCAAVYMQTNMQRDIIPEQLCAGGQAGKDSCNGDSGGPLMLEADVGNERKTVLFGIVSYGPRNCGTAGVPGVYTRVAFYMRWILDNMEP